MKKIIPLILVFLVAACKKEAFDPSLTKTFTISSAVNGATYPIKVALPENFDAAAHNYATIYVLDGEENFNQVATECQLLCAKYSKAGVLVVSIGYGNNRAEDYTPTRASEGGGGAEKFMHFIQDELIPKLEAEYGADTARDSRVIVGHSFGGLLAAYAFTNFNNVFGWHLMLSPSLWYDNEILFRMEQVARAENAVRKQAVFMAIGGAEGGGRMLAPFEAFYQRLDKNYPGITLGRHVAAGLEHMGSKKPNMHEALQFYFQNR